MKQGLTFNSIDIENFKSIGSKHVDINGRSMIVTGKNGKGKSSFIQALLSGIASKDMPEVTIKDGEARASTKVVLSGILNGEPQEYTLEVYFTPKNQKGRLVLLNKLGETVGSPKSVLDSIIGNVSFDIFKFLNDTKANKIKVLKELSGVGKDIDMLDIERKKIYDNRTFLGRTVDQLEATMGTHDLSPDDIEKYSQTIDIAPIQKELNQVGEQMSDWNRIKNGLNDFSKLLLSLDADTNDAEDKIRSHENEIAKLKQKIESNKLAKQEYSEKEKKGIAWLEKNPEPSATEISTRLSEAMVHNEKCTKVTALIEKQKDLVAKKKELSQMSVDIDKIDDKKGRLIKESKLPVEGLTFNSEEIFINGLPMESSQINTAKLIDIGMEISMALNPNLKVVFIHEGSLIDNDGQKALIKKAQEKGYQIIMECVSNDNDLGINFVEQEIN